MIALNQKSNLNYDRINVDEEWNDSNSTELTMHTIHTYPAKFPAFIASKAFEYAKNEGVNIKKVADIFCGCGTVALESKVHNYDFWGCDINPVATLIAKAKSNDYDLKSIEKYYEKIMNTYRTAELGNDEYVNANERLRYWFNEENYINLLKLYQAIELEVDSEIYKEMYKCIFSSILKGCSRWLTKSIKPQVDPNKKGADVEQSFERQYNKLLRAVQELAHSTSKIEIQHQNFLTCSNLPQVDLVITSPPYVTSYEYADLHQLSSLWLNYTDDYRELRRGSIGSIYYNGQTIEEEKLNNTGKEIVHSLKERSCPQSKVKSVARYYLDMQKAITKSASMLNDNGMIFFVIGDTEYKGTKILNSKHLVEALCQVGFDNIKVGKRTISKGICVPYRDGSGKFSKDKTQKEIYHEEYIISGRYRKKESI